MPQDPGFTEALMHAAQQSYARIDRVIAGFSLRLNDPRTHKMLRERITDQIGIVIGPEISSRDEASRSSFPTASDQRDSGVPLDPPPDISTLVDADIAVLDPLANPDLLRLQYIQMYLALTYELEGVALKAINEQLSLADQRPLTGREIRDYEAAATPEEV